MDGLVGSPAATKREDSLVVSTSRYVSTTPQLWLGGLRRGTVRSCIIATIANLIVMHAFYSSQQSNLACSLPFRNLPFSSRYAVYYSARPQDHRCSRLPLNFHPVLLFSCFSSAASRSLFHCLTPSTHPYFGSVDNFLCQ